MFVFGFLVKKKTGGWFAPLSPVFWYNLAMNLAEISAKINHYQQKKVIHTWFGFLADAHIANSQLIQLTNECLEGDKRAIKAMDILVAYKQRLETWLIEMLMFQGQHPFFANRPEEARWYNFRHLEFLLKQSQSMQLGYYVKGENISLIKKKDNVKKTAPKRVNKSAISIINYDPDQTA